MYIFSSCKSPVIVLVCTKTDTEDLILKSETSKNILELCQNKIEQVVSLEKRSSKVFLVNKIFHTTTKDNPKTKDVGDSLADLRELTSALCDYYSRYSFYIPTNWAKIGKFIF